MTKQIMDMARGLGHVDGGQEEALEASCRAVQAELAGRLRPKAWSEDCEDASILAYTWLALAGLAAGETDGGQSTVGEVTVQEGNGAVRAVALHLQTETVPGPWLTDWGLAFQRISG